ncbi:hypothetical protein L6V77_05695 [Myxococcota bacterium]|nr:hypothetical protein [Myxococcota bacterium]
MSAWLFDRRTDLWAFGGSAAFSVGALALGAGQGWLEADLHPAFFLLAIVLVDVAHVWSTLFRVYLDPDEMDRRPLLYWSAPAFAWIAGVALYQAGPLVFWRAFAYLAVFHFVRQQYGFLALYRARAGETRFAWLDTLTIYGVTLYPLIHWHTHLPRAFDWFITGDFLPLPPVVGVVAAPLYWALLAAYVLRTLYARFRLGETNPGRDLLVGTTALCWYLGIVAFDSDYAFTVTNVFIHGVPYIVLIRRYGLTHGATDGPARRVLAFGWLPYLAALWVLAFGEELLWDRAVWQDHPQIFGAPFAPWVGGLLPYLVPLLAVPQLTHYLLDGFIWKRRAAPALRGA